MLLSNKDISLFNHYLWRSISVFLISVLIFVLYVRSEKAIDRANHQRYESHQIADELRQSSDDLTRMVRTYVLTGDPIYKQHYQEILDIRNGLKPRPLHYGDIYWDLVLSDDKRPYPATKPISLLTMMQKLEFTRQEFALLSEAKSHSDQLTKIEFNAIKIVESTTPTTDENRHKAFKMLHDALYHQAKYAIMKPISDAHTLMDQRTQVAVHNAEKMALMMRLAFIFIGFVLIWTLWRIRQALYLTLGGSLRLLHSHIVRIGSGDFSSKIQINKGMEDSVLAWLSETQNKLAKINNERTKAQEDAHRMRDLYAALSQCNQAIVRSKNEDELFPQICQDAVTFGGMKMAWIGLADKESNELKAVAYAGDGTDYLQTLRIFLDPAHPSSHGPTGTAFRENRPFWCQDFIHDPATAQWHQKGEQFGWGASAAVPLHRNGVVIGIFTLYAGERNAFDEAAQKLLVEMATDIDYALDNFERDAARIRAQQKLSDSYHLLTTIINTAPMRIFWKDLDLKYLGCNDVFANDADKQNSLELIGKDDFEMPWAEQAELYRADDRLVIDSGIPKLFFEEPQTTPSGEQIWLSTSKVPLYNQNHTIIGLLGIYQDITDRKKSENALIESEQRLDTIIKTEPECVKVVDSRGKLVQMNPAGLAMLEAQTLEEAQQHGLTDYILPQYRAGFIALHRKVMSGESGIFAFEVTGLQGTRRWLETHATPMRDAKGEVTNLLGVTRDITQRKSDESTLLVQTQAMEQSPNSIIITDFKANIEYVNAAFITNTGYTSEEVIGKNPRLLKSGNTPAHAYDSMWEALVQQKKWQGEFINKRKDGTNYIYSINVAPVLDTEGRTTHYIAIEEDISEQKKTQEKIHYLANFDALTGLPNRIQMDDHLQYTLNLAKRNEDQFALIFLDLDHFKTINDTLGHSIGDLLLIDLAKRLTDGLRDGDTVSRMGGDEFVLLLPETDVNGAAQVAQKILTSIANPFHLENHELSVTASLGIALYPSDGSDIETLSKNADVAMYRAKKEGRNAYSFFTPEMQINSQRNLDLTNALHTALERNEFHLVYQPQLSAQDATVIGAEALIRWEHPQFGFISPVEFIPIAEDNGMILPIGEWVLRTAISQAKSWIMQGQSPIIMAVNLSAVQFRHPNLPNLITSILEEVDLPPEYLELELTEGIAMHNPQSAIAIMNDLHERGIRMSIDDFGTGYSSLAYLKKFKIYKLKIDQSFVRDISTDPEDKAIVSAVIQMGHSLGLISIAEGVETIEQLEYLRAQGCNEIQGYYYSKPLLPEMFNTFCKEHQHTKITKE